MRTLQGHCASGRKVRVFPLSSFLLPSSSPLSLLSLFCPRFIVAYHALPCLLTQKTRFATAYPSVSFYKVDVDEVPEVAQELSVRAMPSFYLFKNEQKVGEVVGANPVALENAIKSNLEDADAATAA